MNVTPIKKALGFLLSICICISSMAISVVATDRTIYINSESNPISDEQNLYAVGGDQTISGLTDGEVYAMSSSGLKKVGDVLESPSPSSTVSPEPTPVTTAEPDFVDAPVAYDLIKVGLYYGNTAISEATLSNDVGHGFQFGYFDTNREFHEIGRTSATSITLIPDWNWTTALGNSFGCYHILRTGSFSSFQEAQQEADRIGGFPTYISGSYFVMYGNYWSMEDGEAAKVATGIDGTVCSQSCHCIVVTETGTNRILFEFDCGSSSNLAIRPISENFQAVTRLNDLRYYGDFQFARLTGNDKMTVVNYVGIEDYTKGVIPHEMYVYWPSEALQAQAMCARNYAVTNFNRFRSQGFDVSADIYSQVYKGIGDATEATDAAVDATARKYIRYQGNLCQTFFFSSDGGATESSENVWGTKIPYLVGVEDPYENDVETYSKNWKYTVTQQEAQTMVNARAGVSLDLIEEIDCAYTAMGNIKSLTFVDINGQSHTVTGNRCNVVMGAKSQRFKVTQKENGDFLVEGSGWGHNCGMSQYGAYSMAKNYGKTAEEIIKFYYTGVYIR